MSVKCDKCGYPKPLGWVTGGPCAQEPCLGIYREVPEKPQSVPSLPPVWIAWEHAVSELAEQSGRLFPVGYTVATTADPIQSIEDQLQSLFADVPKSEWDKLPPSDELLDPQKTIAELRTEVLRLTARFDGKPLRRPDSALRSEIAELHAEIADAKKSAYSMVSIDYPKSLHRDSLAEVLDVVCDWCQVMLSKGETAAKRLAELREAAKVWVPMASSTVIGTYHGGGPTASECRDFLAAMEERAKGTSHV